ncbi:phage baseplate protein [Enterobacter sp. WCHEn045836]|uniref:baseplate J/gp47 family protein n=1 Tax=Enterobacter sp. WCHEn045836 TaxID=2497434 RepID=UPI000F82B62F|nr:baseplate J/gp47 family protein [Enterobacter sp. WCHEn045836]RTQ01308.1 phage baseplate protein [Enterobacter sp. WCHEn045836]
MAEITKDGATGTTLQEYKDLVTEKYLGIDSGWNIDPETPDGLAIAVWCELLANLDEEVINAYHAADPNAAQGQQLDRIAAFAGLQRQPESFSTDVVEFEGDGLIEIPAGVTVRHRLTGTLWATDATVITDTGGKASVSVTCTTAGPEGANPGTLTIIASPVPRIRAVKNTQGASLGKAEESDNAFRVRRNYSVALPGNNQIDNIKAALDNVTGVKQTLVHENEESEPDEHGVYGHSMAIFIDGGETDDIVLAMATHKNPGCGLNRYNTFPNKISVDTFTPKGQPVNITFYRPEYVAIYVQVDIKTSTLGEDDKQKIKEAIVDYTLVGFDETTGFAKQGFRIGEALAAGRLYTPSNYFVGADDYVSNIALGTEPSEVNQGVIPVKFNQLGVFSVENIAVNYV